jgi:hypothetical protein
MKFNKESRILAAVALMCITVFLFSFTKKEKEEVGSRYHIERCYYDGAAFLVLVDASGNPVNFMYK